MKNNIERLYHFHVILLVLIAATLPLSIIPNSILIILLTANAIATVVIRRRYSWKEDLPVVITFGSFFLIYAVAVLISPTDHWYLIEKKVSLLIFPVVLSRSIHSLTREHLHTILVAFVLAMIVCTLAAFYRAGSLYFELGEEINDYLLFNRPYFGMYTLFCVLILLYFLVEVWSGSTVVLIMLIAGITYFTYFSYLTFAKMAWLAFALTLPVLVVLHLVFQRKVTWAFISIVVFGLIFVAIVASSERLQVIITNTLSHQPFDMSNNQWKYYLSMNMRFAIWDCVWQVISVDNHWLWGAGLDNQALLNACYYPNDARWISHGLDLTVEIRERFPFNAHNEFLQVWLDLGLAGLLVVIASTARMVWLAVRHRNLLYLGLLLLFFQCCLTESMFASQKGVVLFGLFNSLLFYQFPLILQTSNEYVKTSGNK